MAYMISHRLSADDFQNSYSQAGDDSHICKVSGYDTSSPLISRSPLHSSFCVLVSLTTGNSSGNFTGGSVGGIIARLTKLYRR
jgi:hypothetical protein